MEEFILASASPRRKELMGMISEKFEVIVSDADEDSISKENTPVDIYVQELALIKAAAVAKNVLKNKDAVIISADTIVVNDNEIMGKPKDEPDAFKMLEGLSGKTHSVYTGYCIMRIKDAYTVCRAVKTDVTFKALSEEKIKGYIKTTEPMDKAGAYGIQGKGSLLVEKISGDFFNVVGFPVSDIADTLEKEFDIKVF